jgi:hypothetical protein
MRAAPDELCADRPIMCTARAAIFRRR